MKSFWPSPMATIHLGSSSFGGGAALADGTLDGVSDADDITVGAKSWGRR